MKGILLENKHIGVAESPRNQSENLVDYCIKKGKNNILTIKSMLSDPAPLYQGRRLRSLLLSERSRQ